MERLALGDDADALGLQAQGDDLALEIVADLLERTDGSHVTSPVVFRARDHRGLDGDLQAEDDRRRTRCGPERSGGRRRGDFLASRGMGVAQGKKVAATALRLRRSRRSRSSARSSHQRGHVRPRAEPQSREKTWRISVVLNKRSERFGVEKETVREMAVLSADRMTESERLTAIYVGRAEIGAAWSMRSEEDVRLLAQARRSLVQRADLREPVRRRRR